MQSSKTVRTGSKAKPQVPLSEQAYLTIRESILRGRVRPGTVFSRRKLAEEYGMSFLPISEALQRLENDGLVESRPRAGTRVRVPTVEEIRGRYVVREALEAQSARLCCDRATFEERLELRRMAEQLDTLYAHAESAEPDFQFVVHTHHLELHMRIAQYGRCKELRDAIEKNHVLIYNWFYDVAAERRSLPPHFHAELVLQVTGTDIRAADDAMREHVRYGLPFIEERIAPSSPGEWRLKR
ncbi:MAG TPA: GntR family transcriptional regulator [Bryobacteraceae bacterium]|nr:GntR family transcriptional regulator [Bryobacteraceae bacterium]